MPTIDRAVDDPDTGERDAGVRQRRADDGSASRRGADSAVRRAELLEQQLGREVVALAVHEAHDLAERR